MARPSKTIIALFVAFLLIVDCIVAVPIGDVLSSSEKDSIFERRIFEATATKEVRRAKRQSDNCEHDTGEKRAAFKSNFGTPYGVGMGALVGVMLGGFTPKTSPADHVRC